MSEASRMIRDSIAALREHKHDVAGRWEPRQAAIVADDGTDVGILVIESYNTAEDGPIIAHIALLASPHVAVAMADLLDEFDLSWERNVGIPVGIVEAVASLKAAIIRGGGS